jgi:hypothetical protein
VYSPRLVAGFEVFRSLKCLIFVTNSPGRSVSGLL